MPRPIRTRRTEPGLLPTLLLLGLGLASCTDPAGRSVGEPMEPDARPYRRTRDFPVHAAGDGVAATASNVATVALGYFGPSEPNHPLAGDMWTAAQWAVTQANATGGFQGRPFRLVAAWSEQPWGTGVRDLARLVYRDRVWALVGGIDGASTHLAEQVAVKARVPLLNPVATDKTVNLVNIPWIFSYAPQDDLIAPVLRAALRDHLAEGAQVLVVGTDHDSHHLLRELRADGTWRPDLQVEVDPKHLDVAALVAAVHSRQAALVAVILPPRPAAVLVRALRAGGFAGTFVGGPRLAQGAFRAAAGRAADGLLVPRLHEGTDFDTRFAQRWGRRPDYRAAYTYDAVSHLVTAIRRAGLDRSRIREALAVPRQWQGATGAVTWDPVQRNLHRVSLASIQAGRLIPRSGP